MMLGLVIAGSSQIWGMEASKSSVDQIRIDSIKVRIGKLEKGLEQLSLLIGRGEGDYHVHVRVKTILNLLKEERAALAKLQS